MSLTSNVARTVDAPAAGTTEIIVGFKIQRNEDLAVYLTPSGGSATLLTLGTHYSISGLGESSASVRLVTATTAGDVFVFLSDVDYLQELNLRNQGAYFPETLEISGLDRMTRMIQQLAIMAGSGNPSLARALLLSVGDVVGSGAYDALSNRIKNLDDPTADQDAATKVYVDTAVAGVGGGGSGAGFIFATVTAAALPTASVSTDGKVYRVRDAGLPDIYKVTMRQSDGATYEWVTLGSASA